MGEIKIVAAVAHNAERLAKLAKDTFRDAYRTESKLENKNIEEYIATAFTPEVIEKDFLDRNVRYLIVESDSSEIGYAKLVFGKTRTEISGQNPAELSRIYLKKDYWGKSLGTKLLDKCIKEAKEIGCDVIWLSVWEHNTNAIVFYQKKGFVNIGTHVFHLASSPETDLIMQKQLN